MTLKCTLTGAQQFDGLFTWQRDPPGHGGLENKIRDLGNQMLQLQVNSVDWSDAGVYNCRYDHPDGNAVDYIRVHVIGLEVHPPSETVKEGESHLFECRCLGFELGRNDRIEWNKDGRGLPSGTRPYDNQGKKLEIAYVKEEHEGTYHCSINVHGIHLQASGQLEMAPDVGKFSFFHLSY